MPVALSGTQRGRPDLGVTGRGLAPKGHTHTSVYAAPPPRVPGSLVPYEFNRARVRPGGPDSSVSHSRASSSPGNAPPKPASQRPPHRPRVSRAVVTRRPSAPSSLVPLLRSPPGAAVPRPCGLIAPPVRGSQGAGSFLPHSPSQGGWACRVPPLLSFPPFGSTQLCWLGASCPSWGVSVSCRVPQTLCANPPPPTWAAAALRMSAGEGERHVLPCRPPGRPCPVAYTHGSGRLAVRLSVHPSTAVWVAPVPGLWWMTLRRSRRASASPQRSWRRAAGTATAGRAALSSSVVPSSVNKPWLL